MRRLIIGLGILACALTAMGQSRQGPATPAILGGRPLLHAHNCYPEKGLWADRIDRALGTGVTPIVIEQDVALAGDRSVVSHDDKLTGSEPTLESHFFVRVQPLMDHALDARREAEWPLVVLHLDFKTNEPAHHRAVWALLQKYRRWLTTAERGTDPSQIMPLTPGPLLVFGSVPNASVFRIEDPDERARVLATASPETLIASRATNYRRWVNFPWQVVERGGPRQAADWNDADRARLAAIVNRAHAQGLGVRFYTLNGHDPAAHPEWTASYNYGSIDAVRSRWRAAIAAGVDLIATDQYEELAALLSAR